MDPLRWQWRLPNGGLVTAVIESGRGVEVVSQGKQVLSEAPRGTLAGGHTVVVAADQQGGDSERPPLEAIVTFDPRLPICVLRVEGHEITPSLWPVRERRTTAPPPAAARSWGKPALLALLVVALLSASVFVIARRQNTTSPPDPRLGGIHRARSGLFIAHFPEDLEAKVAVLPSGVDGIVLENKPKSLTIVIAASPVDPSTTRDPWAIQHRLRDEALANVPKGAARFEESSRTEATCLGQRGAAVAGQLREAGSSRASVWSCAFVHGASSYLVLSVLAEPVSPADQRRARDVIDATELSQLAEIGAAPDPARQ